MIRLIRILIFVVLLFHLNEVLVRPLAREVYLLLPELDRLRTYEGYWFLIINLVLLGILFVVALWLWWRPGRKRKTDALAQRLLVTLWKDAALGAIVATSIVIAIYVSTVTFLAQDLKLRIAVDMGKLDATGNPTYYGSGRAFYYGWLTTNYGLQWHPSRGLNATGQDLRGWDLESAFLVGSSFQGANLEGMNLTNANLGGASLGGANLANANLSGAILGMSHLASANLENANLSRAILANANLSGTNLRGANIDCAVLVGEGINDREAEFDDQTILPDGTKYDPTIGIEQMERFGAGTCN